MRSWKTTLAVVLAAAGIYLVNSEEGLLKLFGQVAEILGLFLVGYTTQDAKKRPIRK